MSCAVQDTGRHKLDDGKVISNDFRVMFGSRITYVEYTSGGRTTMRRVIKKIAESRNYETVFLVGLEELPHHRQLGICIQSNRQEALEIAAELGVELQVFKLTNLDELKAYCMKGKRPYSHSKG